MGTILTVHGTFAHLSVPGSDADSASSTAYWWRPDSPFANDLRRLVRCGDSDGDVEVTPFVWSGENSERDRREAGYQLYQELLRLDQEAKPFCVIAHSHGGSILSTALLEAAARKTELPNLKRWITVGTPFIELRRERFLFMRLSTWLKAMYIASLMLLVVFLGATAGRMLEGGFNFARSRVLWDIGIGGIAAALPFLVFLAFSIYRERRRRFFDRPSVKQRATAYFADRWVQMTHEDDEAVRGLGSLRSVSLPIFDKEFAVPFLSLLSVFMLPALYAFAIFSPTTMVSLAEVLRTRVYQLDALDVRVASYARERTELRELFRGLRKSRQIATDEEQPAADRQVAQRSMTSQREALRTKRDTLEAVYPDLPKLQRALRFKRTFLEENGRPCNASGRLCGEGTRKSLNARLLQHLIIDEVTSLLVDDEVRWSFAGSVAAYLTPVVFVPFVFGVLAIVWVWLVQMIARGFSSVVSRWLDRMTWDQVRRSAVGNDTEDEIAVGTSRFPHWIGDGRPFLPPKLTAEITACSNEATFRSLGKFRNALSEIAFADAGGNTSTDKLLAYLNWNELIHTTYFSVPGFTRLVAFSVTEAPGFERKPGFPTTGDAYDDLGVWLSAPQHAADAAANAAQSGLAHANRAAAEDGSTPRLSA